MVARSSRILAPAAPLHEHFGLACGLSAVPVMGRAHRHDDVEVVLPVGGGAVLEHAADRHDLDAGRCGVFWAGLPHRVADTDADVTVAWLTVPLGDALSWSLPASFVGDLLRGRLSTFAAPAHLEASMSRWQSDLGGGAVPARAAQLEMHAFLLRAAATAQPDAPARSVQDAATAMASHVATHFREPLRVSDVAAVVPLHPSTASAVFRRGTGVSIGEYLAQCRVAEAQRLLISTDLTTSEIAVRAGFGSTSRFYERFVRDCGMPPAAYRASLR